MIDLEKNELKSITGGISVWGILGIIAGAIFGVGVFDGIVRPLKCR